MKAMFAWDFDKCMNLASPARSPSSSSSLLPSSLWASPPYQYPSSTLLPPFTHLFTKFLPNEWLLVPCEDRHGSLPSWSQHSIPVRETDIRQTWTETCNDELRSTLSRGRTEKEENGCPWGLIPKTWGWLLLTGQWSGLWTAPQVWKSLTRRDRGSFGLAAHRACKPLALGRHLYLLNK